MIERWPFPGSIPELAIRRRAFEKGTWRLFPIETEATICCGGQPDERLDDRKNKVLCVGVVGYQMQNAWFIRIKMRRLVRFDSSKISARYNKNIRRPLTAFDTQSWFGGYWVWISYNLSLCSDAGFHGLLLNGFKLLQNKFFSAILFIKI